MTRWAIEGCAREVRGEGGAAGGDECAAKPDDDDDKIVALAPPATKNNQSTNDGGSQWAREDLAGNGKAGERETGEGEESMRGRCVMMLPLP